MRLWQRSAGQILTLRLERADLFWRLLLGLLQADRYTGGGGKALSTGSRAGGGAC